MLIMKKGEKINRHKKVFDFVSIYRQECRIKNFSLN
jgi:hypothetical protein